MSAPLRRALELGPIAQPTVAGLFAWAVTVAPAGFAPHPPRGPGNVAAACSAGVAVVALLAGAVADTAVRRRGGAAHAVDRLRTLTFFSFVGASLVTWICATDALAPARLGAARGVAGMVGWALYAFAFAAPVVEPVPTPARLAAGVRSRGRVERGDAVFVALTVAAVFLLQLVGWGVEAPERAILVRVTTLGAGTLLLGAMGVFLSTRHGRSESVGARPRARRRAPLPVGWGLALLVLVLAGVFYALTS